MCQKMIKSHRSTEDNLLTKHPVNLQTVDSGWHNTDRANQSRMKIWRVHFSCIEVSVFKFTRLY